MSAVDLFEDQMLDLATGWPRRQTREPDKRCKMKYPSCTAAAERDARTSHSINATCHGKGDGEFHVPLNKDKKPMLPLLE